MKIEARFVFVVMNVLLAMNCPASDDAPGRPALPRVFLETSVTSTLVTGKTIQVKAGEDLQAALDKAQPGDEIVLPAGATYTGNFILPAKEGNGEKWITIRTSKIAGLPKEGTRVSPKDAGSMPKIVSPNSNGTISTAPKANHYRLIGLEITVEPTVKNSWAVVTLGGGKEQDTLAVVPHHLILDRVYIHGDPQHDCFRCVLLNSASTAIIDSYLSEGHVQGFDAQAICGTNGPGPFKIVNNYLEGAGENIMFGGGDPSIPDLVPSDIEFRYNHCFKPLSWKKPSKKDDPGYTGIRWTVKNLFELKNARRVLIEGNLFENNWVQAQTGCAILFTVRNQGGNAPWSAVQDVTMINNRVRHAQTAFVVMGQDYNHPSQRTQRFLIRNNLFEQIERSGFQISWGSDDVEIDHNTFVPTNYQTFIMVGLSGHDASGKVLGLPSNPSGTPCSRFKLTNNILGFVRGGPAVDGGKNTLAEAFPDASWERNLLVGAGEAQVQQLKKRKDFPAGFLFEPQHASDGGSDVARSAVGFVNYSGGDYRLSETSKYKTAGTDGKPLGADMDAIEAALKKAK